MSARCIFSVTLVSIFALTMGIGSASAQSLKEARAKDALTRALEREATYTSSVCGSDVTASIDWTSTGDWPQGLDLVGACDRSLAAVEAACRANKKRAQSITRFVCAGDGAGAQLSGSTLRYGANPNTDGFSQTEAILK